MNETLRKLGSLWRRGAVEQGLDDEIRFHLEQQIEKNMRSGMSASEARRRALIRFGGIDAVKEHTRDEFRWVWLEDAVRDLRYGARVLRRAPGFAAVTTLTLAIGLGAATAVFSVVHGVLLDPLPYPRADRIVRLYQVDANGRRSGNVSEPNFSDWKDGTRSFRAMAQVSPGALPVSVGGETVLTRGSGVSREFFDVMGVRPIVGRAFADEELHVGAAPTVIIGDALWRTKLGSAPLTDLRLRVGEVVHQVIGVMPAGFDYPQQSELWIPRELGPPQTSRTAHNFQIVARVADGVSLAAASAELSGLSRALKQRHGDQTWMSDAAAVPLLEQLTATSRPALLMLFAASLALLVIACLNVSNLQLARAATRRRELALRLAVGAGRGRLVRQLLAEALVLSALAAVAGIGIAVGGVRLLVALQPSNLPRLQNVHVDAMALLFAVGTAVVTAAVLGVATALRAANHDVREALAEGTRSVSGGRASERVRQGLVVAQVALTLVLLVGASLLARSFVALMAVDPGYRTESALLIDLQWTPTPDPAVRADRSRRQQEILERLRALPGVASAGLVSAFPLGGSFANGQFLEMTRPDELQSMADIQRLGTEARSRAGMAGFRVASDGYFETMGIRLVRGRGFEPGDGPDAPHVAVISEALAASRWPHQDPIGRFVQFGNMDGDLRGFRIVGVVSDVREGSPEAQPEPLFYGYYRQRLAGRFTVVVRAAAVDQVAPAALAVVRDVDPELPLQVRTVEEAFERAVAGRRFSLTLIGVFGAAALLLATLGIYGLISYLVAERTREFGIRLALGAEASDVLRHVVGRGVGLAVAGLGVGLLISLAAARAIAGMLYGVSATDPLALGSVVLLTLSAVVAASYVPARRAVRVPPTLALRSE